MARIRLLRSTAFRLALLYLALFVVSVVALLGFVWWSTAQFMAQQTDQTIEAEIVGLAERYRRDGLPGLVQVVGERARNQRHSLYLLATAQGQRLGGNLEAWPTVAPTGDGWVDFAYERPAGEAAEIRAARGRQFLLRGGIHLLVGRDVQDRRDIADLMRQAITWAVALTIGLGAIGGILLSRNMLRRIETINRTSQDIMAGDLTRRVPVSGSGDELDRLAESLNGMLDRIEALMTSMRQVTDNVAHDLRSPISRLRSRLELTLLEPPSLSSYREALQRTIEEADALLATFNALLSIARAESFDAELMRDVDLAALVQEIADLYTPLAEDKGLALALDAAPGTMVRGDPHLLSQAIANLVDNAVKYTASGGRVVVRAVTRDERAVLEVADTGSGVPAGEREHIFERFVRLEPARSSPGSGLGLSLVKAVAQRHQAAISVDDNAPGLRVRLVFPGYRGTAAAGSRWSEEFSRVDIDGRQRRTSAGGVLAEAEAQPRSDPVRA